MKNILLYLLIINALAFLLMLIDKLRAKKRKRRIPEIVLLGSAIIGGSLGAWCGMQFMRHKTRHKKFTLGIPGIIGVQAAAGVLYWYLFL
jgi:uncharacterized membrane protein YsdA (DUF1294 family)